MSKYNLEPVRQEHLEMILKWRNSERIRKSMFSENKISLDEHQEWFKKISASDQYAYFIFSMKERPIGLIGFSDIHKHHSHCYWGFYIGEEDAPSGAGTVMGYLALNHMFEQFDLVKICGEVLLNNQASLHFHQKLGFIQEGHFKKHIRKGDTYIDVVRYALFKESWYEVREHVKNHLREKGIEMT
ncbi:UDP-4-amino-4,6-dideoxy-N-acetyl-beta-L-altrosamine N-acetyltransferase [Melghiribacillus thermohalophilus]|uniref:UDP-4-amino-4, 6-dideoxy-N-acetyl-beta-L-altrosamine N-acetyltransferase n=1 Tax=Melghiribacillus thermohalophilus TaxID=1324956 RepID=A0A4R3NH14_9BACI|nr:UDP-4-amino-4,6-dideoxy-N-acetyl-beta-L-altrosamine N-acetyltransferase [Melghiribacillus thermohalophilus]TCT26467.1 UDP-4-amino-4,6-dideoxy-N-acetyl-beta-L-altrosamine N-acetyltransferase [Melghiribacillus thermohalophilus]